MDSISTTLSVLPVAHSLVVLCFSLFTTFPRTLPYTDTIPPGGLHALYIAKGKLGHVVRLNTILVDSFHGRWRCGLPLARFPKISYVCWLNPQSK